jgi:hypothetical protein
VGDTTWTLTGRDRLVHLLARLGFKRNDWRVRPGLYRLGHPGPDSPVFVSANYRLSFDALRQGLDGIDGYILVLDTKGINVWCAAGKGSFGTDELVERIEKTGLADVVETRRLLLPQLSATGVCAHDVRKRSGFKVGFGPVRAEDISAFLEAGKATEEMRTVRYDIHDRAVLIPVEGKQGIPLAGGLILAAYLGDGSIAALGIGSAAAAGLVAFPLLMPWVDGTSVGRRLARAASYLLAFPALTSFIALNWTGASTFTSPTGVRKEINSYVPVMAAMGAAGIITNIAQRLLRSRKG